MDVYPPTQKTTGLPVDEYENKQVFCSGDVRPFLEKAPACRQAGLAVGLHIGTWNSCNIDYAERN